MAHSMLKFCALENAECNNAWTFFTNIHWYFLNSLLEFLVESNDRGAGLITTSDRYSDSDSDTDTQQRSASSSTSTNDPNVPSSQTPEDDSNTAPLLGRRSRREYRFFRRGVSGGRTGQRSRRAAGGGKHYNQTISMTIYRCQFDILYSYEKEF